ncbi:MAG: aspartate kinase [Bacteroidales bacterium]|nr:aspartate kinase [Bacteroidales bacterium]
MMQVLKFGGSSVADATCVSRVLDIVSNAAAQGRVLVVSSAISGCTDALLALAEIPTGKYRKAASEGLRLRHFQLIHRLFTGVERREAEVECSALFEELAAAPAEACVTFGELFSTRILARKLRCEGFDCLWLDSRALIVAGNEQESGRRIRAAVAASEARVFVAPGFIASDAEGHVTTLGRGGSDYSAALYAAALKADSLEIWTDVPGMMSANPRTVPAARTRPELSYETAFDLAERGAKVLYPPTVAPVMRAGIAFRIRNTFAPAEPGTLVTRLPAGAAPEWMGVTSSRSEDGETALVSLVRSGAVGPDDLPRVEETLRRAGIKPVSCNCADRAVEVRVRAQIEDDTLRALHAEYFENPPLSALYLFIAGYGAVGKALVEMIGRTAATIAERTGKSLCIAGLGNSRRCVVDLRGIGPHEAAARLEKGEDASVYLERILELAPRHAIFVDCTDSETLWEQYERLSRRGLDIVSANRRSLAVPYVQYAAMQAAARQNGCFLRYETTVGAALPILESMARGANSCDEITSLEAVVSCSLNRILSGFDGAPGGRFAAALLQARRDGLTEDDPRVDLSGRDALRKLLILAREAGIALEAEDVDITPVVEPELLELPLEDFYRRLEEGGAACLQEELRTSEPGLRPRFVASLERDPDRRLGFRAGIRVRLVDENHPAWSLQGTENAIIVRSTFHPSPLVIRGAGEGALQAASSLLNDIVR